MTSEMGRKVPTKWMLAPAVLVLGCWPMATGGRAIQWDAEGSSEKANGQHLGPNAIADDEIRDALSKLASGDNGYSFDAFYRHPERAARILIAELEPIPRGRYRDGRHPKAVWIIRILRSVTGVNFKGKTTADLSADEDHFLDSNDRDEVEFFGTWMSRDCDWVAPRDAQVAIIGKWRRWFALHGHGYAYVNDRDLDHWYF